jgi:hypothetical protein
MNISDINPLVTDKVIGNRSITERQKTESREKTGTIAAEGTETLSRGTEKSSELTSPQDVFQTSEYHKKVSDLVDQVQNTEENTRQELVASAKEKAASGYYNSNEFLGSLAQSLISTGLTR